MTTIRMLDERGAVVRSFEKDAPRYSPWTWSEGTYELVDGDWRVCVFRLARRSRWAEGLWGSDLSTAYYREYEEAFCTRCMKRLPRVSVTAWQQCAEHPEADQLVTSPGPSRYIEQPRAAWFVWADGHFDRVELDPYHFGLERLRRVRYDHEPPSLSQPGGDDIPTALFERRLWRRAGFHPGVHWVTFHEVGL